MKLDREKKGIKKGIKEFVPGFIAGNRVYVFSEVKYVLYHQVKS